jgi:hypothetical protein
VEYLHRRSMGVASLSQRYAGHPFGDIRMTARNIKYGNIELVKKEYVLVISGMAW